MKTNELLDMLAERLSRAREATAATVAGGNRTPELHMPRAMNMIEQCRAAIAQARADAATGTELSAMRLELRRASRILESTADTLDIVAGGRMRAGDAGRALRIEAANARRLAGRMLDRAATAE